MTARHPFGNDPAKTERYKAFWKRENARRPLVAFTFAGWFPFQDFSVCRGWRAGDTITPDMIRPEEWLDDQEGFLEEGNDEGDDVFRGVCPTQVAVPFFLPGALGCALTVLPDSVMAHERHLSLTEAMDVRLDPAHPWLKKYVEFGHALAQRADGRYPVSHNAELGPTDLHALLRGQGQGVLDLVEHPEASAELLERLGDMFKTFFKLFWKEIPLFLDGYYDAQYQVWSPGPIVRMQEDATALFSPDLYERFVQPVDRIIAAQFDCPLMHLHTTSMHLLDLFIEIEEIKCFEINLEPQNVPLEGMLKYFRKVQEAGRCLIVRGSLDALELRTLLDAVAPRGLYLQIMVRERSEIDTFRPILGL